MHVHLQHGVEEIGIVSRHFAERISILSGARILRFGSETEAVLFLKRFVTTAGNRTALGLGAAVPADEGMLRSLAHRILSGELVVLAGSRQQIALRHERPIYATPREVATAAPPPPAPAPRPQPQPEQETMVPNPVAQAGVLQAASESGAPLCET